MKRKLAVLIITIMVTSLSGCGSGSDNAKTENADTKEAVETQAATEESTQEEEEDGTKDIKIVIGATGLQEDQFTQVMLNGYKDAAKELGIELITANSQHSAETETTQIRNMLEAGAKGIIIECVNPETSAAIAEEAEAAGAYVFACAIGLNSDAVSASALNDCYDLGKSTGEHAAKYFAENFNKDEEINVAIVSYDGQDAIGSGARIDGFFDQLKDYKINIVGRQEGEVADKAYNVTTDMLTANKDIDVFFCASENGVVGCVNAIEAAGNPNQTVVFGVDCSEQLVEMMKSDANILQGVTAQDPYTLGTYSVKAVYDAVVNGKEPADKEYHADCILLTRSDIEGCETWLNNWNEHAK